MVLLVVTGITIKYFKSILARVIIMAIMMTCKRKATRRIFFFVVFGSLDVL